MLGTVWIVVEFNSCFCSVVAIYCFVYRFGAIVGCILVGRYQKEEGIIMSQLLAIMCLALWNPAVVDGDTISCGARIRLIDYDTPELHGRCTHEVRLARLATDELRNVLPFLSYTFAPCATHNYGRLCARASFRNGKPLAEYMIDQGLAVSYICSTGCPVKRDWCKS
jgi:hypothetical protein